MTAPIFTVAKASAAVTALLGELPLRFYPFGQAPRNVPLPYAVWQQVDGEPENYLGDLPDIDAFTLQVDAYGETEDGVREVTQALARSVEESAYVTAWLGERQDPQTQRWRSTFRVDWLVAR